MTRLVDFLPCVSETDCFSIGSEPFYHSNLDKVTQNTTDAYLRGADFGEPQKLKEHLGFSALESDILKKINETREYVKSLDTNLIDLCKNKNESCTTWAISGECTKNPGYMKVQVSLATAGVLTEKNVKVLVFIRPRASHR